MKFRGSFASDARGSLGGITASRNAAGAYLRRRVAPVNPRTPSQGLVRGVFASQAVAWRTLTDAQRAQWNRVAGQVVNHDTLGQLVAMTGEQLFVRCNSYLVYYGQAALTTPVEPYAIPSGIEGGFIAPIVGPPAHVLGLTFTTAAPSGNELLIEATAPLSAGKTTVSNGGFRYIDTEAASVSSPVALDDAYLSAFGAAPPSGSKVFFRLTIVKTGAGYRSPSNVINYIIP